MRAPKKLRALARHLPLDQGPWLELACGAGQHLVHLAPGSSGLDRDPAQVARLREAGLSAEVRDLDRAGWSEGLSTPRRALAVDLLMHLREPEACLSELGRLLPRGAPLALCEWAFPPAGLRRSLALRLLPGAREVWEHPEHLRRYERDEIGELLVRSGFRVERDYVHGLPTPLDRLMGWIWPARTWIGRVR